MSPMNDDALSMKWFASNNEIEIETKNKIYECIYSFIPLLLVV